MRYLSAVPMTMAALLFGCGTSSNAVECEESANCNLEAGGACVEYTPSGHKWCQYPDVTCDSGMRWSDFDTGDDLSGVCVDASGGADAGVDASPVDAAIADASVLDATPDAAPFPPDAEIPPDADTREWQPPVLVANVNTTGAEASPDISANGLELYFNRVGSSMNDIYVATRASTNADFGTPVAVSAVNTSGQEIAPCISSDGLELYIGRIGTGIVVAKRSSPGAAWGTPTAIGVGSAFAARPSITGDGLTLFFNDDDSGFEIYKTTRPNKMAPWETPEVVSYPGTATYRDADISADGRGLLLSFPELLANTDVLASWRDDVGDGWVTLEVIPSLLDETLHPRNASWNEDASEIYITQDKSSTDFSDTNIWVTRKE